ncbi:hypothetical protein ACTVZO_19820 [Streptomyces sp. IBSNAI002]|uniref:hypothetical protein n=1 Tax=Streptomyces sp. IBSNAI002 TaxID=3457500 RepID=UPI003FD02AD9
MEPTTTTTILWQLVGASKNMVPIDYPIDMQPTIQQDAFGTGLDVNRNGTCLASKQMSIRFTYEKFHSALATTNAKNMPKRALVLAAMKANLERLEKQYGKFDEDVARQKLKIQEYKKKVRFRVPIEINFDLTQYERLVHTDFVRWQAKIEGLASQPGYAGTPLPDFDGEKISRYCKIGSVSVHSGGHAKKKNSNSEKLLMKIHVICDGPHDNEGMATRNKRLIRIKVDVTSPGVLGWGDKVEENFELAYWASIDAGVEKVERTTLVALGHDDDDDDGDDDDQPHWRHDVDSRTKAHFKDASTESLKHFRERQAKGKEGKKVKKKEDKLDKRAHQNSYENITIPPRNHAQPIGEMSEAAVWEIIRRAFGEKKTGYRTAIAAMEVEYKMRRGVNIGLSDNVFDFAIIQFKRVYHANIPVTGDLFDLFRWADRRKETFLLKPVFDLILRGRDNEAWMELERLKISESKRIGQLMEVAPLFGYQIPGSVTGFWTNTGFCAALRTAAGIIESPPETPRTPKGRTHDISETDERRIIEVLPDSSEDGVNLSDYT